MEDHNTRLIVMGTSAADARYVAEALTREAFHNVAYFPGRVEDAQRALPTLIHRRRSRRFICRPTEDAR